MDTRHCGDQPEGVKASRSRGGQGLEGSVIELGKGEC